MTVPEVSLWAQIEVSLGSTTPLFAHLNLLQESAARMAPTANKKMKI